MYTGGTTYHFKEWACTNDDLKGWWACGLYSDDWPAEVRGKDGSTYFLCAVEPSKAAAHERLLEKINNMR